MREIAWVLYNSAERAYVDKVARMLRPHKDYNKGIIIEAKMKSFTVAGSNRKMVTTQELNKYLRKTYHGGAMDVDEERYMREWEDETLNTRNVDIESCDESQQTKEGKPDRYEYEGGW